MVEIKFKRLKNRSLIPLNQSSWRDYMEDKRKFKRRHLIYYLKVFCRDTDNLVGYLANINQGGLMLINEKTIQLKANLQLKIILPSRINRTSNLEVSAESRWRKKDFNPDLFKIGFQFTFSNNKEAKIIDNLIESYGFQY